MDTSSQVIALQKDVHELEQMNGSLIDRVKQLERELTQTRSEAKIVEAERDSLRRQLDSLSEEHRLQASRNPPVQVAPPKDDLCAALLEIESFESLLRIETDKRVDLESRLASRQKQDVENGLAHSLEVSELERMNTMLAAEKASVEEKLNKLQVTGQQSSSFYKVEQSTEPFAEPEQDETSPDPLSLWYGTK
jgi:hypothetical protein